MESRSRPRSPSSAAVHSSHFDGFDASAVLESPARRILPLRPLTEEPESDTLEPAPDDSNVGNMLLDHLSRLSRWVPRMSRYAAGRVASHGPEPITAFLGGTGPVPSTPLRGPPAESSTLQASSSLLDLERWSPASWWRSLPPSRAEADSDGLDVDLSQAFESAGDQHEQQQMSAAGVEELPQSRGAGLFLHQYSPEMLTGLFREKETMDVLIKRGYTSTSLIFDTSDPIQHRVSLVDRSLFAQSVHLSSSERFLLDLYMKKRFRYTTDEMACYQLMKRLHKAGGWEELREITGEMKAPYVGVEGAAEVTEFLDRMIPKWSKLGKQSGNLVVTEIVWMQMHDPFCESPTRPLLPGQRFPGLGLAKQIGKTIENLAIKCKYTDTLVNFPFHWHNAAAYVLSGYTHFDPVYAAYFDWLTAQLQPAIALHGFSYVSWCVSLGHLRRIVEVRTVDGGWESVSSRLERWTPSEQILPTSRALEGYLNDPEYAALKEKYKAVFDKDGGAMLHESSGSYLAPGREKRARLEIDHEGAPELWKYSTIWKNRDPETGEFR